MKDRSFAEVELLILWVEHHRARYVARHHVRRELDAPVLQTKDLGKRADKQSFAQAGNAFQQNVTVREEGDQKLLKPSGLTTDDLVRFGKNATSDPFDRLARARSRRNRTGTRGVQRSFRAVRHDKSIIPGKNQMTKREMRLVNRSKATFVLNIFNS